MGKPTKSSSTRSTFARRLEALRISQGYDSQKDFAEALGVQAETYRRYERGETEPSLDVLRKIKRLTQCSLDFLIANDLHRQDDGTASKQH